MEHANSAKYIAGAAVSVSVEHKFNEVEKGTISFLECLDDRPRTKRILGTIGK